MLIPSVSLQIGPVPFGKVAQAEHGQFGSVKLVSDGAIDDSFKALPGGGNGAELRDFRDPQLAKFIATERALANASLSQAQERFTSGSEPDKYKEDAVNSKAVSNAVGQAGLKAHAYPHTDWRGVITHTTVNLNDAQGQYLQKLALVHTGDQTEAILQTSRRNGTHQLTAPVNPDGTINFEQSQESLTLNTPWLSEASLSEVAPQGIKSLEDPRLERLASAAQQGFHLSPEELGEGWKSALSGHRQTWTLGNWGSQEVVLDSQARTFEVSAESDVSCNGGNNSYTAKSQVRWHDGHLQHLR